eukprot:4592676-Amphidinium_carterae.2
MSPRPGCLAPVLGQQSVPLACCEVFVSPNLPDPVQGIPSGAAMQVHALIEPRQREGQRPCHEQGGKSTPSEGRGLWVGNLHVWSTSQGVLVHIQNVRAGSCRATPASTSWKDQMALSVESKTTMLMPRNNAVATTATSEAGASEASSEASS